MPFNPTITIRRACDPHFCMLSPNEQLMISIQKELGYCTNYYVSYGRLPHFDVQWSLTRVANQRITQMQRTFLRGACMRKIINKINNESFQQIWISRIKMLDARVIRQWKQWLHQSVSIQQVLISEIHFQFKPENFY